MELRGHCPIVTQNIDEEYQTETNHKSNKIFRVKLVFECEFEISWSFGPSDLGTPGP